MIYFNIGVKLCYTFFIESENIMEEKLRKVQEKATIFLRKSLQYYGKEIALESNQIFSIDQIINDENLQNGIYDYKVQYGFPQSGCVSLEFSYSEPEQSFSINEVTVYAPSADKEFVVANFAPKVDLGVMNVSANFGVDMGTTKHTTTEEIANNPNALNMLDFANNDLDKAQVLGECCLMVPEGSKRIPITNSTTKCLNKER